jgi:hypothetical protein
MHRTLTIAARFLVVGIGVAAGYATTQQLSAQQGASANIPYRPVWETPVPAVAFSPGQRTLWPHQPAQATHWSIDDIRKSHQTLADADRAGRSVEPNSTLHDFPYWTRTHAMFLRHVPEKSSGNTAEQHLGYAQFIVVTGGTGSVTAGGQLQRPAVLIENSRPISGELRGPAITGGQTFQLSTGDVVSIPGDTPTQFKAASSGGLTYMVMKINAMLYPWEYIR